MDSVVYEEVVHQLARRCKDLEARVKTAELAVSGKNAIIDDLSHQVATLTSGNTAGRVLVHYSEETMDVDGHAVTSVSGGADYVGDFETGFPRQLTLSRYRNAHMQAAYYHESVVNELKVKLVTANSSGDLLKSALEERF